MKGEKIKVNLKSKRKEEKCLQILLALNLPLNQAGYNIISPSNIISESVKNRSQIYFHCGLSST